MIVVAGEALIDLVPAPGTAPDTAGSATEPGSPGALLPRRGGGPYNTALALGRLGSRTAFCSRVSSDRFGTDLLRGLRADGVDTTLVQRGPEPTTLAVAEIGEDAPWRTSLSGPPWTAAIALLSEVTVTVSSPSPR
ncbi:PfkB family carbohydrate kinase, partial [Streptomyces sp. NPDC048845]|uniref:PfkB family carbohydrate kinase n=1 Tax=Streptomyces sp. NPDC048845 TaxID=3155390 RepID=UPI003434269A